MVIASTFIGHRKYFRWPSQVLSFFEAVLRSVALDINMTSQQETITYSRKPPMQMRVIVRYAHGEVRKIVIR